MDIILRIISLTIVYFSGFMVGITNNMAFIIMLLIGSYLNSISHDMQKDK